MSKGIGVREFEQFSSNVNNRLSTLQKSVQRLEDSMGKELGQAVQVIKNNHLTHIESDVEEIKKDISYLEKKFYIAIGVSSTILFLVTVGAIQLGVLF